MKSTPSIYSKDPIYLGYFVTLVTIISLPVLIWINYHSFIANEKVKNEALRLEELIGKVIFYDEALTMSASMAFATGDLKWKDRYNQFVELYDASFAKLIKFTPYSKAGKSLQTATDSLLNLEENGFSLLKEGKRDQASALLQSASYVTQKRVYSHGVNSLIKDTRSLSEEKLKESKEYFTNIILISAIVFLLSLICSLIVINKFKKWRELVISVTKEENQLNWVNNGLTQLDEILRSNLNDSTKLFSSIINFLVPYLQASNGVIFRADANTANNIILTPVSSYAYEKGHLKEIKLGDGLLGQAGLERKTVIIDNVPDTYINISSGLGRIKPKNIIIQPIIFEPNLQGIIELAFLGDIEVLKKTFLEKAVQAIAATMVLLERKNETEKLLHESQKLAYQLQEHKEELLETNLRLEKMRKAKEYFLAHMSHEIRTPVNNIIGLSNILKTSHLNPHQSHLVHLLEVSSVSLSGVINDILDLSKLEAGKLKIVRTETDLFTLINSVAEIMRFSAEKKGLTVIAVIAPAIPKAILLDEFRLNQVLMNLLSNAIKFTKTGSITLSIKEQARKDELIQLEFAVTDTGIGMKPEAINRIFNSYEQAEDTTFQKFGGTGLGLSIVKSLVELDGGELFISSQEHKGSVFSFINWYKIADTTLAKVEQKKNKKLSFSDF